MTDMYVQGHTAEGAPYGPVYILTVDEDGRVAHIPSEHEEAAEQAREDEWRDAVARVYGNNSMNNKGNE